jgi:methionine synthase II (cobalamin-independent)
LEWVLGAAGEEPWVHSCATGVPWALLRGAGAQGLSGDLSLLDADDLDLFAEALEAGERVALGIVPATEPDTAPTEQALTERVVRMLDVLGLDPDAVSDQLVITPTCGLAGATPSWARRAAELSRAVARELTTSSGPAD